MAVSAPAVTPDGVRDGDPAALAGLCAARGPSVLAYCRHVAGADVAAAAAADAFARFRAAVVATDDLTELNPEALLISATRKVAAAHVDRDPQGVCAEIPSLLAARAEKELARDDLARLEEHLESCWTCRAPVARFEAAERAYRDPPDPAIDPQTAERIVAALAAAAPARGADAADAPQAPNGSGSHAPAAGVLPVLGKGELEPDPTDEPTSEYRTLDEFEADFGADEPATARRTAARAPRAGAVVSLLGALGARAKRGDRRLTPRLHGPEPEPVRERLAARAAFGAHLEGVRRARPALPLPVVLPIAVVTIALVVALFVAGVFGGSDPASSPRVAAPDDGLPTETSPADVVVVPGARDASAAAVERAKARERERERGQRGGPAAPERETRAAPRPAAPPPAAATPPAPRPAPPPAPPPPAADPAPPPPARSTGDARGGRAPKIDAGSGATGSEQIPPEQDTSTVPDLAPPPETATKP
jgi:hypothetical protein